MRKAEFIRRIITVFSFLFILSSTMIIAIAIDNCLSVEEDSLNSIQIERLLGYTPSIVFNTQNKDNCESEELIQSRDENINSIRFDVQESNETHIWIDDPTNQTEGYWIAKDLTYVELNSSRGQTYRHFYNLSSNTYTFRSDYLVQKEDVKSDTDWVIYEEYPLEFIARLTNGSIYRSANITQIKQFFSSIDNTTLWGVGIDSFEGVLGFFSDFSNEDWGHMQYLYYPRLRNGTLVDFNQPLYAIYLHLYAKLSGVWYDQILNDRSLYFGINPRNNLHFDITADTWELYFTTYNINILNRVWDFEQGFKFNISDQHFHMINNFRCRDQDFEDIGFAYEITSSPQSDNTPYQPEKFVLRNDTESIMVNISQAWSAGEYLEDFYSEIDIISQNNESFTFYFDDMEFAGFSEKYLCLHNQLFPSGESRLVLQAGMYGFGSYLQNTVIEIDPIPLTAKYTIDNLDLYKDGTSWITTSTNNYFGVDSGGDVQTSYICIDTGLEEELTDTSSIDFDVYITANTIDSGEGVYGRVYNVGGNGDTNTAREDSTSTSVGTYTSTSGFVYGTGTGTGAYITATDTEMETLTDFWVANRDDSENYISLYFYQSGCESGDWIVFDDAQASGNAPRIAFDYVPANYAPDDPTLNTDSGNTYAGKTHTIKTDHTDPDGATDISYMYIRYADGFNPITLRCPQSTASGDASILAGSSYLIGTPTYSHTTDGVSNGYRVTWTICIDFDWSADELTYTVAARTYDDGAKDTGYIDLDTDNTFENELIVNDISFVAGGAYPDGIEYDGGATLDSAEDFRGGVDLVVSGHIRYEGATSVSPDTDSVDVELSYNDSLMGESYDDDALGSDGYFLIPTYSTPSVTDTSFTIAVSLVDWKGSGSVTYWNSGSGNHQITTIGVDSDAPTFGSWVQDTDSDSGGDGYAPNLGYEDDEYTQGDFSGCSDVGSGILYYRIKSNEVGTYGSEDSDGLNVVCQLSWLSDNNIYYNLSDSVGNIAIGDTTDDVYAGNVDPSGFTVNITGAEGYPTDYLYIADSTQIISGTLYYNSGESDSFSIIANVGSWGSGGAWKVVFGSGFDEGSPYSDTSSPYTSQEYAIFGASTSSLSIEVVNNCGEVQLISLTTIDDITAPTATFSAVSSPFSSAYYNQTSISSTIASQSDSGAGLTTNFVRYKLNSGEYSSFGIDQAYIFSSCAIQYNNSLIASLVDRVGNIQEYTLYRYVDTINPVLGWLTLNESYAPNWFDQSSSIIAQAHINWVEAHPYHVNASCSLSHTNDLSPLGSYSLINFTLTGQSDGSYAISIIIYDLAGNSDSVLAGTEAPINLESGMSSDIHEFWYYFYYFRTDGVGLDWYKFNTSYVLDENYRNYTEIRFRGGLFAQKYLNDTSSIRIITRDYFGNVIYNQSFTLPASYDKYISLDVNTFKVVNIYDGIVNLTLEHSLSSTIYTEQITPYEIFRWDMYASVYNITVLVHGTSIYATDENNNVLNDFQVNLTITDVAIYIDASDPIIIPIWGNVVANNSIIEFGDSNLVGWCVSEIVDWEIWLNSSLKTTGTSSYPQYTWDTSSYSINWYNLTLQVTSSVGATNTSYIRLKVGDTIAPTISFDNSTITNNSNIEWGSSYTLTWTFSESCSYWIYCNGSLGPNSVGSTFAFAFATSSLYNGYWYNLTLKVQDGGGNIVVSRLYLYNVDSVAPLISIGFSSKIFYYSDVGEHTFTWTVYDLHNYNASLLVDGWNRANYTLSSVTELIQITIDMELGVKLYKITVYDSAGNYASDTVEITVAVAQDDGGGQNEPQLIPDDPLLQSISLGVWIVLGIGGCAVVLFLAKKFGLLNKIKEWISAYV